jgi:uncharacterized protein YegL
MRPVRVSFRVAVTLLCGGFLTTDALAQLLIPETSGPAEDRPVELRKVEIHGKAEDRVAQFTVRHVLYNRLARPVEARLIFPVPREAAVHSLTMTVDGQELTGELLREEVASREYEEIVRRYRDPALLEYLGNDFYRTRVFPLQPHKEHSLDFQLTFLCPRDGETITLWWPLRGYLQGGQTPHHLAVRVRLRSKEPIKAVYSLTHSIEVDRPDSYSAIVRLGVGPEAVERDLKVCYRVGQGGLDVTAASHWPDEEPHGFLLLFLSGPVDPSDTKAQLPKDLLLVLDKSGSMVGQKLEQCKEAAQYVLRHLHPEDRFNVIVYDSVVEMFRQELQEAKEDTIRAACEFVEDLEASGGTNIDEALQTALRMLDSKDRPRYLLFLSDGRPTVGEQREVVIAERVRLLNKDRARVFVFAVGHDVNSRLMDRLASVGGGTVTYVAPEEDIEEAVSRLYQRIQAPVLTEVKLSYEGFKVSEAYPARVRDLFRGDQVVIVARYQLLGGDTEVRVRGLGAAGPVEQTFPVTLVRRGDYGAGGVIARLWAARRIGYLLDQMDLEGKSPGLVEEIVELSRKYGIVTPYTAYLAREPLLGRRVDRALRERTGRALERLAQQTEGEEAFHARSQIQGLKAAGAAKAAGPASASLGALGGGFGGLGRGSLGYPGAADSPGKDPTGAEPEQRAASSTGPNFVVRVAAGRAFYLENGVWVEASLTDEEVEKAITVRFFTQQFFAVVRAMPVELRACLRWSRPVVVRVGRQVYRLVP